MTMSVEVGERLEAFINDLIASGRYNSKSEVLREGLRLVQDRETRLAALDAAIALSLADLDAGRVVPAEEVFQRLEAKYRSMSERDG